MGCNLAKLLKVTNRLGEAEPLMRKMLEILIAFESEGYQHPDLIPGLKSYSILLHEMGLTEPEIHAKVQSLQSPPPAP